MDSNEKKVSEGEADKAKILSALGGKKGLFDAAIPALLFLLVYNITKELNTALIASLALAVSLFILRLFKKESIQYAISGVVAVGISALFVKITGRPEAFYAPSLIRAVGFFLLYAGANLVGWPILGVMLGPILGENFAWRKVPARKKVYMQAGWLWAGMFAVRFIIQYPLYKAEMLNALGIVNLLLGFPLYFIVLALTWLIIRRVPVVKPIQQQNMP